MVNDFEKLREKLHASIEENGLNSEKTRKISEKYNELVNIHYQKERQYNSNNIMYVKYISGSSWHDLRNKIYQNNKNN